MMRRRCGSGKTLAICLWTAAGLLLGGCAADLINDPVNRPLLAGAAMAPGLQPRFDGPADDIIIGLSFSGGGTRAAAFAHGVLEEMAASEVRLAGKPSPLIEHVKFVSGVSGGAVAAAYFGLKGPAAVEDFRERFLLKNAEEDLRTSLVNPKNFVRAFAGGANDSTGLPRWLDQNLFDGATFDDVMQPDRPVVIINASDIFSRVPFVFGPLTFSAFCSDIRTYPLSQAVAASAAVPVIFAPVVIKTYPGRCQTQLPAWLEKARADPVAPSNLRAFANAIDRYKTGEIGFIKLLDGGLTDNFGLHGFLVTRLGAETPYGPLSAQDAVRIRELALFVVNAGRGPSGDWVQTVQGPSGGALFQAVTDTAIDSSVRTSLDALDLAMRDWQAAIVKFRCGLTREEVLRLRGSLAGWNCRNVKIRVSEVNFASLGQDRRARLDAIATRFRLPEDQVDDLIDAGRAALRANQTYRDLLQGSGGAVAGRTR